MSLSSIEKSLFENAKKSPSKTAVVVGNSRLSYDEVVQNVVFAYLHFKNRSDLRPGDCIVLAADKQIEFVYAYFGAHLAGLCVAPVDFAINAERLSFIIKTINAKLLVGLSVPELAIPSLSLSLFSGLTKANTQNISIDFPLVDSVADILFTTGTTGIPKGVPLTYKNIAAAVRNINTFIGNTADDIELLALPLSHSFGLGRLRCVFTKGGTLVLINGFTNVKRLYRVMEEERVTGFTMVPASYRYLKKFSGGRLGEFANQITYIEMGSAFFSEEEKCELADLLPNTRVCMHYGLTEASRSTFMEFHDDKKYLSSVGKASPFTEAEIFDENGRPVKTGEEGEICIKGDHVTNGYLNIAKEESFYGDYFRTGDWGYKTVDGYIYLVSRKKELINVGGKKVSPVEVEEQLKKIQGIADCACVGVADPSGILGEVVKAFIVKDEGSDISFDEIKNQIMGKVEDYKLPAVYDWISEIPKTHNGKIQRLSLK